MTDYQNPYEDSKRAAQLLAAAFMFDTDTEIDPDKLRQFVINRWARVAPLAHRIHAGPDMTKAEANAAVPVEPTPMQKVRNAVRRYGDEMAERVRQDYSNKFPSADPVKAEVELLKAIEDLVKP